MSALTYSTHAIVLAFTGTGLAVIRSLSTMGVPVHAVLLGSAAKAAVETRWSRKCNIICLDFPESDTARLTAWLREFSQSLPSPPVVFPTSDRTALFLSQSAEDLAGACLAWRTPVEDMARIVSKDGLYRAALDAGIPLPPTLIDPTAEELAGWCSSNPPPYLAKPYFESAGGSSITGKNQVFDSAESLLDFSRQNGLRRSIVQRMIDSGDGRVIDIYGLCARGGKVVTLASHRRLRQYPPNTGATSFGEIPLPDHDVADRCLDLTQRLLAQYQYHGIFGIEWLHERDSGELFLTDFNARPFSSIGHLRHAGLNLPFLAYLELQGKLNERQALVPTLEHSYWMDFNSDLRGFRMTRAKSGLSWSSFLGDVLRCRSFAYLDLLDPGPGIRRGIGLLQLLIQFLSKERR